MGEAADLQEVYVTERQWLYGACTRVRDFLRVRGVEPAAADLEDLRAEAAREPVEPTHGRHMYARMPFAKPVARMNSGTRKAL